MGSKLCVLELPLGWHVEEQIQTLPLRRAAERLRSEKFPAFSELRADGENAALLRHVWCCPFCGSRIPAYGQYFGRPDPVRAVPEAVLTEWFSDQFVFGEEQVELPSSHPLRIRTPLPFDGCTRCPECGESSFADSGSRRAVFFRQAAVCSVSVELRDLDEILAEAELFPGKPTLSVPLREAVEFRFLTGEVSLSLRREDGSILTRVGLSERPELLQRSITAQLFRLYKRFRQALLQSFRPYFGEELPFRSCELTPDHYALMTRFVGFPRQFYDAVPLVPGLPAVEPSFERSAVRLRFPVTAAAYLREWAVPDCKSVRRTVFRHPGLLFYREECEFLWSLLRDVNRFCRLLSRCDVYTLLSRLHTHPGIRCFFEDYAADRGSDLLFLKLRSSLCDMIAAANNYGLMSDYRQAVERRLWNSRRYPVLPEWYLFPENRDFSIPVTEPDETIPACTIGGYDFAWLRNSADFSAADSELLNGLAWRPPDARPVVAVRKRGRFLASIELDGRSIVSSDGPWRFEEARGPLFAAYEAWKSRFQLTEAEPSD